MNKIRFNGLDYAPCASFNLLQKAWQTAEKMGEPVHVGGIFATDTFYGDDPDWWKKWADYGVLVTEMESSALYTLANKFGIEALSILTVSDSLATGDSSPAEQREKEFTKMAKIALEIAP